MMSLSRGEKRRKDEDDERAQEGDDADEHDEDSQSESPHSSSPSEHHPIKPASTSPPAVRSNDDLVPVRSASPISPSSSPSACTSASLTKETLSNSTHRQQHLFSLPSNEHEMSEAMKHVVASVYSEVTPQIRVNPHLVRSWPRPI
ncbi:unnamed protein product [Didymodactylos carnosus]|uniref:Uncharacterized protein n=1 Tax=Didymodactylos carnosus TaxID=1234261 RepID=A0A8S2HH83_9BILA|nr:unnamed protein product [Didymodactylos carnosus]CAF3645202.1 unnamed protein product [Didymodactylos carnosus]